MPKTALFFHPVDDQKVCCDLCPQNCLIYNNKSGNCQARRNVDGELISLNYGCLTAVNTDPIEKKPLYHFFPGSQILSIGSFGCNLHCSFCQNSDISQSSVNEISAMSYAPEELLEKAKSSPSNIGIAYTYNEPTVFFEFMVETAELVRKSGMKNLMVSNGFINLKPLDQLTDIIDGFNIDLKFFSQDQYRKIAGGNLENILASLKRIRMSGKHLEITYLVVTGLNDQPEDFNEMINWIACELGEESILHISRYFPRYHHSSPPTQESKLLEFHDIASRKLKFVYIGNSSAGQKSDTICPGCGKTVIKRSGYQVEPDGLDGKGCCIFCGHYIAVRACP